MNVGTERSTRIDGGFPLSYRPQTSRDDDHQSTKYIPRVVERGTCRSTSPADLIYYQTQKPLPTDETVVCVCVCVCVCCGCVCQCVYKNSIQR